MASELERDVTRLNELTSLRDKYSGILRGRNSQLEYIYNHDFSMDSYKRLGHIKDSRDRVESRLDSLMGAIYAKSDEVKKDIQDINVIV